MSRSSLKAQTMVTIVFDEATTTAIRRAAATARLSVKQYVERLVTEAMQADGAQAAGLPLTRAALEPAAAEAQ